MADFISAAIDAFEKGAAPAPQSDTQISDRPDLLLRFVNCSGPREREQIEFIVSGQAKF